MAVETPDPKTAERTRIHQLWQAKLDADPWNGWRALLAGWEIEGVRCPVDEGTPFTGYYRTRRKDKTFAPVAYWIEDGHWNCLIDGQPIEEFRALANWPYVSRYPISYAWYEAVAEKRQPWPDADDRTSTEALAKAAEKPAADPTMVHDIATTNGETTGVTAEPGIGHNNPPEETPSVLLKNRIDNAKGGIKDYVDTKNKNKSLVDSDEKLPKAKSLKNLLTELSGEAKKERDKFSRPHLDALEAIRSEWTPLVDDAADSAKLVNNAMDEWATIKLKKQRAEEQRVQDEKDAADKVRRDNEEKTRIAEATGETAELETIPEVKEAELPKADTTVRAGYGRAGSVKTERYIKSITDIDLLFGLLKTHKELKDKMIELAGRALNAGIDPPGCEIDERAKIRG